MSRQKGFSLTEILTTVVIMAVLAGVAIPSFTKSRDKAAAAKAVAFLRTIRLGEQMYYAKNEAYIPCNTTTHFKDNLGVELTMDDYTFSVVVAGATFTATGARSGNNANRLEIYTNGTFGGAGTQLKYVPTA